VSDSARRTHSRDSDSLTHHRPRRRTSHADERTTRRRARRLSSSTSKSRPRPRREGSTWRKKRDRSIDRFVMGAYLSQPVTTKDSSDGASDAYAYGTTAMQGWRTNMEVRRRRAGTIGLCGSLSTGGSSATSDGNERGEGSGMDEYSQRRSARGGSGFAEFGLGGTFFLCVWTRVANGVGERMK